MKRINTLLAATILATSISLGVPCIGSAQESVFQNIATLQTEAMAQYDSFEFDLAREIIDKAIALIEDNGLSSDPKSAKIYLIKGIVEHARLQDNKDPRLADRQTFIQFFNAASADINIEIPSDYKSSELDIILERAKIKVDPTIKMRARMSETPTAPGILAIPMAQEPEGPKLLNPFGTPTATTKTTEVAQTTEPATNTLEISKTEAQTAKVELEVVKTETVIAKTTEPEVAKTTEPGVAKTTEPEVAKTTEPEIAKTTEPEVAKTTEPEVAKTTSETEKTITEVEKNTTEIAKTTSETVKTITEVEKNTTEIAKTTSETEKTTTQPETTTQESAKDTFFVASTETSETPVSEPVVASTDFEPTFTPTVNLDRKATFEGTILVGTGLGFGKGRTERMFTNQNSYFHYTNVEKAKLGQKDLTGLKTGSISLPLHIRADIMFNLPKDFQLGAYVRYQLVNATQGSVMAGVMARYYILDDDPYRLHVGLGFGWGEANGTANVPLISGGYWKDVFTFGGLKSVHIMPQIGFSWMPHRNYGLAIDVSIPIHFNNNAYNSVVESSTGEVDLTNRVADNGYDWKENYDPSKQKLPVGVHFDLSIGPVFRF